MSEKISKKGMPIKSVVHHEAVLQAIPNAIIVIDLTNTIIFANLAAQIFFGLSEIMLKKKALSKFIAQPHPIFMLIDQIRASGGAVNEYEVNLNLPHQVQRVIDIYATVLADDSTLVLVMIQEREMAQLMERQLTHRNAVRSVSGMAAILAHEIKNPLSGIRGAAQLLEAGASIEDQPLAQLIVEETDRIRDLVDRMEVFGDERPIKQEPVNIHLILDHVKRLAQNGFAKGIHFSMSYDPSLPHVMINRDKMIQACLNLIKNSAEAIGDQPDGKITLITAFKPGLKMCISNGQRISLPLEICISDNGSGIPDHIKPHLFEPFLTTKSNGSGLGLALVAKIVSDHGGVIECETKSNQTIFRMLLPMHQSITQSGVN